MLTYFKAESKLRKEIKGKHIAPFDQRASVLPTRSGHNLVKVLMLVVVRYPKINLIMLMMKNYVMVILRKPPRMFMYTVEFSYAELLQLVFS